MEALSAIECYGSFYQNGTLCTCSLCFSLATPLLPGQSVGYNL